MGRFTGLVHRARRRDLHEGRQHRTARGVDRKRDRLRQPQQPAVEGNDEIAFRDPTVGPVDRPTEQRRVRSRRLPELERNAPAVGRQREVHTGTNPSDQNPPEERDAGDPLSRVRADEHAGGPGTRVRSHHAVWQSDGRRLERDSSRPPAGRDSDRPAREDVEIEVTVAMGEPHVGGELTAIRLEARRELPTSCFRSGGRRGETGEDQESRGDDVVAHDPSSARLVGLPIPEIGLGGGIPTISPVFASGPAFPASFSARKAAPLALKQPAQDARNREHDVNVSRTGGPKWTGGDFRGARGATDSAENRAMTTEVARHRSFLKTLDASSIPAASTHRTSTQGHAPIESLAHHRPRG